MSDTARRRPSQEVGLPDDVTDPLLWRLAFDVARAHRPDESGRCGNPDCPDESVPCAPLRNAERAMRLARGAASAPTGADAWESTPEVRPTLRAGSTRRAA